MENSERVQSVDEYVPSVHTDFSAKAQLPESKQTLFEEKGQG